MTTDAPVLITGITGFIARQTALDLLRSGRRVRGTLREVARGEALRALLARHGAETSALEFVTADLRRDDGWDRAMAGCAGVLHMASPYPLEQPRDRFALVPEAREGALRVLAAARSAGAPRVVMTSSLVAVMAGQPVPPERVFDESDWTNTDDPLITPYTVSKALAERAAWDAVRDTQNTGRPGPELATINPGFVLGPTLDGHGGASAEVIALMLQGAYPGVPRMHLPTVDVRDVAAAHIAALDVPAAAGRRFIVAERTLSLMDMARVLAEAVPERRGKLPKLEVPDWLVRLIARFDRRLGAALPELGKPYRVSHRAAEEILGLKLRDARAAVVDSARSLLMHGRVT